MTHPRRAVAGLAILAFALAGSACGGLTRPQGWATPAFDDSTAYVFLDKDRLSAVELGDGGASSVRWTFPDSDNPATEDIDLEAAYGTPTLKDGLLYFAAYEGDVFALDTESGVLSWRFDSVDGSIVDGPAVAGGRVIFGTTEGRLYVLTDEGQPAPGWEGGKDVGEPIWATPVVDGENVYVGTMEGSVLAYRLGDGSALWDEPFEADAAVPTLAMLDGTLFVPSFDKHVYLLDPANGRPRFDDAFPTGHWVWNTPAFADGVAYFGDLDGNVYALDITSNQMVWSAPYKAAAKVKSGPALVGDTLVVVDRQPVAYFLSGSDGTALGTFPLAGGTVRANLQTAGDRALAITTKGELFEIDPQTRTAAEIPVAGS